MARAGLTVSVVCLIITAMPACAECADWRRTVVLELGHALLQGLVTPFLLHSRSDSVEEHCRIQVVKDPPDRLRSACPNEIVVWKEQIRCVRAVARHAPTPHTPDTHVQRICAPSPPS